MVAKGNAQSDFIGLKTLNLTLEIGVNCRQSAGACDPDEVKTSIFFFVVVKPRLNSISVFQFCTGSLAYCPRDEVYNSTRVCRAKAGNVFLFKCEVHFLLIS